MQKDLAKTLIKLLSAIFFVYLFLVAIGLMGTAFKGFGVGFAQKLIRTTANPFVGLCIGILTTSIIQSSSSTTSIVVGMVASGVITVGNAVPIIMGANIGTTVTGTFVTLGHIGRREEFKRAVSGGTLNDFFKVMCVAIMFPLEIAFGFLQKMAGRLACIFADCGGINFTSPIKLATQPAVGFIKNIVLRIDAPADIPYILLLIISVIFLFSALYFIVRLMSSLVVKRAEIVFNNVVGKHGLLAILAGFIFTVIIQSSSITIALMIPLLGAGILTAQTMYPLIMGANIGTTVTAILASLATANIAAITVAFVHFLFNIIGVCCIYPIKPLRQIPRFLAEKLSEIAFKKRRYVILYIATLFFLIPSLFIALSKLIK